MENKVGRALRRGVALGLVLAAAWGVSLMADLGAMGDGLAGLGEEPALARRRKTSWVTSSASARRPRYTMASRYTAVPHMLYASSSWQALRVCFIP